MLTRVHSLSLDRLPTDVYSTPPSSKNTTPKDSAASSSQRRPSESPTGNGLLRPRQLFTKRSPLLGLLIAVVAGASFITLLAYTTPPQPAVKAAVEKKSHAERLKVKSAQLQRWFVEQHRNATSKLGHSTGERIKQHRKPILIAATCVIAVGKGAPALWRAIGISVTTTARRKALAKQLVTTKPKAPSIDTLAAAAPIALLAARAAMRGVKSASRKGIPAPPASFGGTIARSMPGAKVQVTEGLLSGGRKVPFFNFAWKLPGGLAGAVKVPLRPLVAVMTVLSAFAL